MAFQVAPFVDPYVGYLWAIYGLYMAPYADSQNGSIHGFPKWLHMQSPKMASQVAFPSGLRFFPYTQYLVDSLCKSSGH